MTDALENISPIDGRYQSKTNALAPYFSEFALIKYRVLVEIEYFILLSTLEELNITISTGQVDALRKISTHFSIENAKRIKEIETITNHDVKAVEYFLKEQFDTLGLAKWKEFIHFGLTSQDINNTAIPLSIKEATQHIFIPKYKTVIQQLTLYSKQWANIPMLAHTHGQPASPTFLGKELFVFVERLSIQLKKLSQFDYSGKFGGATGNLNAHKVSYPSIEWISVFNHFLPERLGLKRQQTTTQIAHYDGLAELFQLYGRINTILTDLCRDLWTYISMDYFKQKINPNEVGSSAMPHKVNPIDFENAEGNMGIANALFTHLANKLPISRLQRDLTDSTVLRNAGTPIAHSYISLTSIEKGLNKLVLNNTTLEQDLEHNYSVVAEAIQNILRREGIKKPYEKLKALTRNNKHITKEVVDAFIDSLGVSDKVKKELKAISPKNYTGYPFNLEQA